MPYTSLWLQGDYVPADRAMESHFLNLMTEKQWGTNTNVLYWLEKGAW